MFSGWVLAFYPERLNTCTVFLMMDVGAKRDHYSTSPPPPFPNVLLFEQADWNTAVQMATQGLVEARRHSFRDIDEENVCLRLFSSSRERVLTLPT